MSSLLKEALSFTEEHMFKVTDDLEEATLWSDAENMEEAWASQAILADLKVSQQRQEDKLRMAYMVASQVATVAIDAATPGGAVCSRDDLRPDDSGPPPVSNLSVSTSTHQANKDIPN